MELVKHAAHFEDQFIIGMLQNDSHDRPVKVWADGVNGHYERQRRSQILDASRTIIISPESPTDTFLAEIEISSDTNPTAVPIQVDGDVQDQEQDEVKEDAWGFDEESNSETGESLEVEEDGWGFDDDVMPDDEPEPKEQLETQPVDPSPSPEIVNIEDEPDPSEAWGWNDDDDAPPTEETAWDDPWTDDPATSGSSTPSSPVNTRARPPPEPTIASPRIATRLERVANKGKKHLNGASPMQTPAVSSPLSSSFQQSPPPPAMHLTPPAPQAIEEPHPSGKRPSPLIVNIKETYLVSERMKRVISIVEDVLHEGRQFTASKLFSHSESSSAPGTIILQSAPAVLDLHMALYPVKFTKDLEAPDRGMRFSNDCLFLSSQIERMESRVASSTLDAVRDRLSECKHHYKVWGDSWYYDVIVSLSSYSQRDCCLTSLIVTSNNNGNR